MGRISKTIIIVLLVLQTLFLLAIGVHIAKINDILDSDIKGVKGLTPKFMIELECEDQVKTIYGDRMKCKGRID